MSQELLSAGIRGDPSRQQDSHSVPVNHNDDALPESSIDLYYHRHLEERSYMFPLGSKFSDKRALTSSTTSTIQADSRLPRNNGMGIATF